MMQDFIRKTKERVTRIQSHSESLVKLDYDKNANKDRLNELADLMLKTVGFIDSSLMSLRERIELCAPLLRHISDSVQMFQVPINDLCDEMERLKSIGMPFHDILYHTAQSSKNKKFAAELINDLSGIDRSKKIIQDFINSCENDQNDNIFNNLNDKSSQVVVLKGRKIFVFFNTIISFIAKYRSRIKSNLDIVIKMSELIRANGREILNSDLRLEDIQKLVKWSKLMTCQDAIDEVVFKSPSGTFLQYVQLLVKQNKLKKELKLVPSIAFGVEEIKPFNLDEFKECVDKIKKLKSKYEQVVNQKECRDSKEIHELCDALAQQHEFLYSCENFQKKFNRVSMLVKQYCAQEFNLNITLSIRE